MPSANTVDERYKGLMMVRNKAVKGKGDWYWKHLEPILIKNPDTNLSTAVKFRCSLCDAVLSASDHSRIASEHLKPGTCPNFTAGLRPPSHSRAPTLKSMICPVNDNCIIDNNYSNSNRKRSKNSTGVIEEIVGDDEPTYGNKLKRPKKKDRSIESEQQIVVKNGARVPVLESDGFPISSSNKGKRTSLEDQVEADEERDEKKKAKNSSDYDTSQKRKVKRTDQDDQPERKKKKKKEKGKEGEDKKDDTGNKSMDLPEDKNKHELKSGNLNQMKKKKQKEKGEEGEDKKDDTGNKSIDLPEGKNKHELKSRNLNQGDLDNNNAGGVPSENNSEKKKKKQKKKA